MTDSAFAQQEIVSQFQVIDGKYGTQRWQASYLKKKQTLGLNLHLKTINRRTVANQYKPKAVLKLIILNKNKFNLTVSGQC